MRYEALKVINAADASTNQTSAAIDTNQIINMSVQGVFSSATLNGTLKIQASNDPCPGGSFRNQFTPTNWVDIPNASASVTSGASVCIPLQNIAYGYIRVVYTASSGTGTVTALASLVGA